MYFALAGNTNPSKLPRQKYNTLIIYIAVIKMAWSHLKDGYVHEAPTLRDAEDDGGATRDFFRYAYDYTYTDEAQAELK